MQPGPHILFISTDQQTLRAMSCAGNPYLHTPNLDALAAGGIRFEKSYCTSPVCGPSRASMVTGRMPHEVGVDVNAHQSDPSIPHIGELLQAAGYETAWAGKWHAYPYHAAPEPLPGFEYLPIPAGIRATRGLDADDAFAEQAIRFLQREHERPFFLGLSLHNPHDICYEILKIAEGAAPYDNLPPLDSLPPLPSNFEISADEPEFIGECRERTHYGAELRRTIGWSEHQWRAYLNVYYRLTERVDGVIGRVLDTLREQNLEEETLVIFSSDHGEGTAAHRWVVKLMLWEEVVQVPFIIRAPGWSTPVAKTHGLSTPGGVERDYIATGLDIVPTICDYANAALPAGLAGLSLRPLLEGKAPTPREFVVAELQTDADDKSHRGRMVRTQRYKYVVFARGHNPEMLFDIDDDPGELHNLAGDGTYRAELERHRRLLREWCARTNDDFAMT